jgi:hypothetical protein
MWLVYLAIPCGSYLMCLRFLQVAWHFTRSGELPTHDDRIDVGNRFSGGLRRRQVFNELIARPGDECDPMTATPRWRVPLWDHPHWSAILATGGGLLFTGKETGEFIGADAETGQTLWQFQTGSGMNAQPITFTQSGRQYVTVLSGIGGVYWNQAREQLKNVPQGGSVWTFALMAE